MKFPKILQFLIVSAIVFLSCTSRKNEPVATNEPLCISDSMANTIRIDTATTGNIDNELKLSGEIKFSDSRVVKLFPFSSGKVMSVKVSLGDKVVKGQVLAVIKSAEVAGNYSDLSTASNDVAIAKKQLDNAESLYKNGIASEREFIEAKETYQKTVTNAGKVREQININGNGHTSANGTYLVTAPMSGYVVEKKITEGGFIRNDNNDNMFTIGDIDEVWVWANVYESDISKVKEGYQARVTTLAYPDQEFIGVVDKVNQILDPETKVMKIRVRMKNTNHELKPEMFANIMIQNREGIQAVAVPFASLIAENGKNYVVVYRDKCNLKVQEVDILKTVGDKTYLRSGLTAGDKIISQNQILLFRALTEE